MRDQRISTRVCIMGCTSYGVTLAKLFASNSSFGVMVYDSNVETIEKHRDLNVDNEINFEYIMSRIFNNNFYIIVGNPGSEIDETFYLIREHASPGSVIVIESSIPIGKSKEYNTIANGSFTVGHSPIRYDPERTSPSFQDIPKVIAAANSSGLETLNGVYGAVFNQVIPTTYEVAEASNLLESSFRVVNISFINEFSNVCKDQNINPFEVLDVSLTKPFGFMEFIPGMGYGGPNLSVESNLLMESGGVVKWPILALSMGCLERRPSILANDIGNVKSVLIVGVGYKPNSSSWVNSPAIPFVKALQNKHISVHYVDPFIRDFDACESVDLPLDNPDRYDCIVVNHPYCLSYWANPEFKNKVTYYCHH